MVDAGDPEIACQRHRLKRSIGIGMQPAAEAEAGRGLQVAPDHGLADLALAPFDVGKLGQPAVAQQRQQFLAGPRYRGFRLVRPFAGRRQSQEEGGYHVHRVALHQRQRAQQFRLGALPASAPGLGLYSCGAMPRHRLQILPCLDGDAPRARGLDCIQRRRRVGVRPAGRRKREMRVAVHESRHHHPAGRADLHRVARRLQILNPAREAHILDQPIADKNRSVDYQSRLVQQRPAAGLPWAAHGKQLARAPNQYRARLFLPPGATIASGVIDLTRTKR